jgi:hypothetical protein
MNWIPNTFRHNKIYNDLSEEMRLHIEECAEQLRSEGLNPKEAERQARVAFGNRTYLKSAAAKFGSGLPWNRPWQMCVSHCGSCAILSDLLSLLF